MVDKQADPQRSDDIEVSETKPGVYVATCHKCGVVIGVKHTLTEIEIARISHVCETSQNEK